MRRLYLLLLLILAPSLVWAAPTQFTSPNYGVQSVIFGGTGVVRTSGTSNPPQITTAPTVSDITQVSATVSWVTDKQSSSIVMLGTTSGIYSVNYGYLDQVTDTNHQVVLTSLVKGTTYYFEVRSSDIEGNLVQSSEITFTTNPGDTSLPVVTSGPSIAQPSATSIIVTWQTDKNSNTQVDYGIASVTENSAGNPDELTTFHQVEINGLISNQKYNLLIKSKDEFGNQYVGPVQTITTPNAPSITNVQITDITLNSALVQWQTSTSATSVVSYGTVSGQPTANIADPTVTQNHLVHLTDLGTGTVYYLRLGGVDASNNHLQSDEYIFKTVVLPQITDFTATQITASTAHLSWESSSDIDELIRYTVLNSDDPTEVGKELTAGNDKLVSDHAFDLTSLDDDSVYSVSVVGKDIFGNQAISSVITFHTPIDRTPPQILNIKTDTTVDLGSQQTVQVLVSFSLSKPSKAIIEYGTGASGPYDQTVNLDSDYSTNKFMVIPDLVPGQSYHFHIIATDVHGNQSTSADYLVLAPTQPVSLLDLIFGQIQSNFGWLKGL